MKKSTSILILMLMICANSFSQNRKAVLNINNYSFENKLSIIASNLIAETVSIQISTDLFNSDLLIYNQMKQLVKTIKTSTNLQILTDVRNLFNGMCVITTSNKKLVNPIKFMKSN